MNLQKQWKAFAKGRMIRLINWWPPMLFAGIRVTQISDDFREIYVSLKMHAWNRNYVGVHFGGSLYAMTDPFYMLMLMENLGRDYVVWDKAATIRFKRPGTGTVKATFTITEADLEKIRLETASGQKYEPVFTVQVIDSSGTVVTEVEKVLYIKRKDKAS